MWLLSANTRKKLKKKMKINPKTNVRLVMNKLLLKSYMITESKQKIQPANIIIYFQIRQPKENQNKKLKVRSG